MAPAAEAMASMSWGSIACAGAGAASVSSPIMTRTTATSWNQGVWRSMPPSICQALFLSVTEFSNPGEGLPRSPWQPQLERPPGERARAGRPLLLLAGVDLHDGIQEPQRVVARPLEGVASDDGAEAAAVADAAALVEDRLVV